MKKDLEDVEFKKDHKNQGLFLVLIKGASPLMADPFEGAERFDS